jgi:hypothetical protein
MQGGIPIWSVGCPRSTLGSSHALPDFGLNRDPPASAPRSGRLECDSTSVGR